MDTEKIIEKILNICKQKNLKPTIACAESGAGKDLVANLRKGIIPSVEKVAKLAAYLGVTTSELLGEELPPPVSDLPPDFLRTFLALPSADKEEIMAIIEYKAARNKKGEKEK